MTKGGSYVLLEAGEGCHVPPGCLVFQCTAGYLMHALPEDDRPILLGGEKSAADVEENAVSFLVPRLKFG